MLSGGPCHLDLNGGADSAYPRRLLYVGSGNLVMNDLVIKNGRVHNWDELTHVRTQESLREGPAPSPGNGSERIQ